MAQEFKLGRLRYNWAGTWAPATVYSRDDVVLKDGKAYACLVPGTSSANFYTDLYATFPVWNQMTNGKTWTGPWTTGYSYGVGHIVIFGGKAYYSSTAHTSTTFAADSANWTVYSEFDGWKTAWAPNTVYGINDVVRWGGIVYKCVANHTSAATAVLGLEANQASWSMYYSGNVYLGAWQASYRYKLNDLVKLDANIYRCTQFHTSTSTFSTTNFTLWIPGQMFDLVWSSSTTYQLGDTVVYGGDAYVSKTENNLNNDPTTSTTNWGLFNIGYTVRNAWNIGTSYAPGDLVTRNGVLYEAVVNSMGQNPNTSNVVSSHTASIPGSTTINVNSVTGIVPGAIVSGAGFISGQTVSTVVTSTASATAATITAPTPITISSFTSKTVVTVGPCLVTFAIPSQAIAPEINSSYTVSGNSNASYNGSYTCAASSTTSITLSYTTDPGTYGSGTTTVVPSNRNILTLAGTVTGTFAVGMLLLDIGSSVYVVSGSGTTWSVSTDQIVTSSTITGTLNAIQISKPADDTLIIGQPLLFKGVNTTYWSLLIPGKKWTNRWMSGASYAVGDIVRWNNVTYVCINSHSSDYRPDEDSGYVYWVVLIAHDPYNSLNVQGDLRIFKDNKPSVLPITSTTGEIDTYVLGVSTDLPNWRKLNEIAAVYYVDNNIGVDSAHYGVTWDQPWRTIKYACDTINQGFYFKNAVTLLEANQAYIVAEMYEWMLYQMSNSISPFYPDSLWSVYKTQRDAAQIIDSVIYDLKRGGNSQSVAAALSFFFVGSKTQLINSLVESSVVYYVPALEYVLTLMISVVENTALTSYQALNNVPNTTIVNQYIDTGLVTEPNTSANITSLMNIVLTALSNKNTYAIPNTNTGISASIYVKTGTYSELLPIIVPENVAVIGDELRSTVIQPATDITLFCKETFATGNGSRSNTMVVNSTIGLTDQMPLQFISPFVNNASTTFGGVISGKTYYVVGSSITSTSLQLNDAPTFTFKGSTIANSNILSNVTSITKLSVGMRITGPGIQDNTYVSAFSQAANSIATITLCIGNPLEVGYIFVASNAATSVILQTFTASGNLVLFSDGSGNMTVYAGDCLKDMFYFRNGSGMRNVSFFGLKGTLTADNQFGTARTTGGAYTSLDPGNGPNDSTVWIFRRSPYVQNITVFGDGCVGMKIDGYLHNGGSKSIVSNDYTMVISDGIGLWCTGPGAITEAISVFSYYCYAGYLASDGGRIRSANGNSSYGTFGIIGEGFDPTEIPLTGIVNNQSQQVQAGVQSAFGTTDQVLKLNYTNAGSAYYVPTTNMLNWSNDFLTTWSNDSNLSFSKNNIAPNGYTEAWLLTGSANTPGTGFIQQSVSINPAGYTYTNLPGVTQDNAPGNGATFNITITPAGYVATVNTAGTLYQSGNNIKISGSLLGGKNIVNDLTMVVGGLAGTGISSISATSGTVPTGTNQGYTLSMYVYAGTSASVDIQAVFSGTTTRTSGINYSVTSNTVTPYSGTSILSSANGGTAPTQYGAQKTLATGWYRVWMSVSDSVGVNNTLTFKFFPQSAHTPIANTYSIVYGAQLELSEATFSPDFYLETTTNRFSAYANFQVVGAGANALLSGDEIRSQAVFNSRITTDTNGSTGGAGYATSLNTAQEGSANTITLASTDQGIYNYLGMRVFVNGGTGAGQYGFISYYNNSATTDANGIAGKTALVLKESLDSLSILTSTYNATPALNRLSLPSGTDLGSWYVNQAVQFIPTYYTTTAASTSVDTVVATATVGGTTNTMSVPTDSLLLNMPVTFTGTGFNVTAGFEYYIVDIDYVNNVIQLSTTLSGNAIQLTNVPAINGVTMTMTYPRYSNYIKAPTANMVPNIDIQFTGVSLGGIVLGTNYYINDVIDANNFTISTNKVTLTSTSTIGGSTNTVVVSTTSLVPMNPIVFSGTIFDAAISPGVTYYISKIVDATSFNITETIIRTTAFSTTFGTNVVSLESVTGFVVGQPIIFSAIQAGRTFGNIVPESVYYILTINVVANQITISSDKTNTFSLTDARGLIQTRTCPEPLSLGAGTGSMTLTSTGTRLYITHSVGNPSTMNATFSTSLFGGVNSHTVYYITAIDTTNPANPRLSISTSQAGTPLTLVSGVGNMQMAASGWDNINPGTPPATSLDSTSAYFIEPRTVYSAPPYSQLSGTVETPLAAASFKQIAYGNNYFIAIPTTGSVGAISQNGVTWTGLTLPSGSWNDIAYGNRYWIILGDSLVAYSASNGAGWRTSQLPTTSSWGSIEYGNGTFVAISSDNTRVAYSTNQGLTWNSSNLSSSTPITLTGTPVISTAQQKFGISSLSLNGSSYITVANDKRFAYNNEDFTIEFFWRPAALGTQQVLLDQRTISNDAAIYLEMNTSGNIRLFVNNAYQITSSATCSAGTFNHIAVSRASGVTRLFVNGTLTPTTYTDTNVYEARPIRIGASFTAGLPATGHIDEIRISKGVSRYTTLFTPIGQQFTSDANTMLLMHLDDVNNSTGITSSIGSWVGLTYGSGVFLAVNSNGQTSWSTNGVSWNLSTMPTRNVLLTGVTIIGGAGQFNCTTVTNTQLIVGQSVKISGALSVTGGQGTVANGTYYISATNGKSSFTLATTYISAIQGTNPITTTAGTTIGLDLEVGAPVYTDVAFGNGRFLATQFGAGLRSALSFDAVNWKQSDNYMSATSIEYGQGVFVAVNSDSTAAWVSEYGDYWKSRTLTYGSISAMAFGFTNNNVGVFSTLTGTGDSVGNATAIYEGARAQGRATVDGGVISAVSVWEPGSGYTSTPTLDLIDYNVSVPVLLIPRISNGTLANPTFVNRGTGYSTTSTVVTITGNGYADTFQIGLNLILKNLSSVPLVGSSLSIDGNPQIYKITNASAVFGSTAPFIEATVQVSPEMSTALSPVNGAAIQLRQFYSQCRVTNHDFLLVGTGNKATCNYPFVDSESARVNQQAVETNQGRVFYTSTDENGNFTVGGLFGVQQATGTVTLSATQFGLSGLETLSLGGIAVGSSSVVVNQFSTDNTFAANLDTIIPTQRAVKSFLTGRLSQGGANTYTGNFIAGTVYVGGPYFMSSTVLPGLPGSGIRMANKTNLTKIPDGAIPAFNMFMGKRS
jgi:hypothetical protein